MELLNLDNQLNKNNMGYRHKYSLEIENIDKYDDVQTHIEILKKNDYIVVFDSFENAWGYAVDTILEHSLNFPNYIFKLYATSEELDYNCYVIKNGEYKTLVGKVVYEEISNDMTKDADLEKIKFCTTWEQQKTGVVFVEKEEEIKKLWKLLCEQDEYWKDYKHLIHVIPTLKSEIEFENFCSYTGKTAIDYPLDLKKQVNFFMYQMGIDEYYFD